MHKSPPVSIAADFRLGLVELRPAADLSGRAWDLKASLLNVCSQSAKCVEDGWAGQRGEEADIASVALYPSMQKGLQTTCQIVNTTELLGQEPQSVEYWRKFTDIYSFTHLFKYYHYKKAFVDFQESICGFEPPKMLICLTYVSS